MEYLFGDIVEFLSIAGNLSRLTFGTVRVTYGTARLTLGTARPIEPHTDDLQGILNDGRRVVVFVRIVEC